jgi:hypothetical protein
MLPVFAAAIAGPVATQAASRTGQLSSAKQLKRAVSSTGT